MKLSSAGEDLISHFEGKYLEAYKDKAGIWSIGRGHTGLAHNDGTVFKGRVITEQEEKELFALDMEYFVKRVNSLVKVSINQNQFDALVSFDFNTGSLHISTMLNLLNDGDYWGAAKEFDRWNKYTDEATGKKRISGGLTRRRGAEASMFCGFDWKLTYYK